ncbi:MAG: YggS family pyridoxal phosphate-dependent enzyme [Candidatus Omnitrophica bacterium]|nr:YggS family pyridoxal phosphate-dependent enzyme [Candidatus Omnitrophota bacterium]
MIGERVREVQGRIASACRRAGRKLSDVTLVCVTKQVGIAQIEEAVAAGITDVGENRVQEAQAKHAQLAGQHPQLRWHLIGHLQSNKAKSAASFFHCIHSIDSLALAEELERQLSPKSLPAPRTKGQAGEVLSPKSVKVLVEVNTSGEVSKYGVRPEEAARLVEALLALPRLRVSGLMTMAPIVQNPEQARPYFRRLRTLRDEINNRLRTPDFGLTDLSMGMSQDYEVAIEEGATMVRVGTAVFGAQT